MIMEHIPKHLAMGNSVFLILVQDGRVLLSENLYVEAIFSESRIQLEWESPYENIWFQYDNGHNLDSLYVSKNFGMLLNGILNNYII